MTRTRLVLMAILAVFCMSAVAASQASAAKKGEIVNSKKEKLVKNTFTATSGVTILENKKGAKVTCQKDEAKGTIETTKTGTQEVKFKECKNSLGQSCKSVEGKAGEIIIKGVKIEVWFTDKTKESLQLLNKVNGKFAFTCAEVNQEVEGAFCTPVTAAQEGKLKLKYEFTAAQEKGTQKPSKCVDPTGAEQEPKLTAKIAGEAFEGSGQSGTEVVTFAEEAQFL